jgi:GT2 family glycosyltransferase
MTWRWRARCWLRTIPKLAPGQVDRFGRSMPVGFMESFSGCRPTGYLSGFCMIYRRTAVAGLAFDEELPTYGGEDRDFSMEVGRRWRLLLCGDLQVEHHCSTTNRVEGARQVREAAFGMGRSFAKRARWLSGSLLVVQYLVVELLFDLVALVGQPSRGRLAMPVARAAGVVAGFRSVRRHGFQRWTGHEHDLADAS